MRLFLILIFSLICAIPPLSAQGNGIDQSSELVTVGPDKFLRWYGHADRNYFIQVSDPNDHLKKWTWAPIIENGNDADISYEVDGTADKGFFRLKYTSQQPGINQTLETADFDGDYINNWDEITEYATDPLNGDTDGDGLSEYYEIWYYGSNPNSVDSDGDGLSDGDEVWIYSTDPMSTDTDGDGIADNIELTQTNTSPTSADTDGDGISDGDELAQGTDPNSATSYTFQWMRVTRSLQYDFDEYPPPNNKGTLTKTAAWDASLNTNEMLTAAIPFPDLKARLEMLTFPGTPPATNAMIGLVPSQGDSTLIPNPPCYHATMNHHRFWLRRGQAATTAFQQRAFIVTERTIDGTAQAKTFEVQNLTIPANDTTSNHVDVSKGFTQNFTGNTSQSESFTGRLCPLEVIQDNMPNLGVTPENSTDLGGNRGQMMIGVGGIAYVTGEPEVAQLRSRFRDMPASVSVEWRLEIRSERTERGTVDDRNYPAQGYVTLSGNQEWDITATMNNEFVGGNCTLFYRLDGGNAGSVTFRIRGKNPLDADARTEIDGVVGASFTAYAWGMAKHESRFGPRAYNQFNAGVTNGTPFYGAPNGWGMCQIDRPVGNPGVTTAEVWNWHTNVGAMNAKLLEKQTVYNRFIGYFRDSYGSNANWSEPPAAHTIGATTLPAEAWGVMVLYNGADAGVPQSEVPTHEGRFRSPWAFNPNNGTWTFHDNSQNYASGRVRPELEGTVNTQE